MKLVRLEVQNYRSIKRDVVTFGGLDCLVGPNNAGKSNTLRAISYLINGEPSSDALHYGKDKDNEIDVRGYFEVEEDDWERLKIEGKREVLKECVLEAGMLGVCRRSGQKDLELLRPCPKEPRLSHSGFLKFHAEAWASKESKEEFCQRMKSEYPELVSYLTEGKESNKGEWPVAHEAFVKDAPEGVEFTVQPGPPPTGIPADVLNVLPRTIYVPAVRDASESTKTTTRAELGALLDQLSTEVQEELDAAINEALKGVYAQLNIVEDPETREPQDNRHKGVRLIEERISSYVNETFGDVGISLEFPNPESKSIFQGAKVWIEESDLDRFAVNNVGEGVQRVLIFSLLRAYADLKRGRLHVSEQSADAKTPIQPALILYEEAELFLHPGLQTILLRALQTLSTAGDQVVYTTHSPFMVQGEVVESINLVSKSREHGTTTVEFHARLNEHEPRARGRLLQIQHVSRYVFADRVVLVEGNSDRIVLEKLARTLDPEQWDFANAGIPVLPVGGKGDLGLFSRFLRSLDIRVFVVTDVDAVEDEIERLCESDGVAEARREVCRMVADLAGDGTVNKAAVRKLTKKGSWEEVFVALERLRAQLEEGRQPQESELEALSRLIEYKSESARREVLRSPPEAIETKLASIAVELLDHGVLMLAGYLEDYYPAEAENKLEAALQFDPTAVGVDELRRRFRVLREGGTDLETFLAMVFQREEEPVNGLDSEADEVGASSASRKRSQITNQSLGPSGSARREDIDPAEVQGSLKL